MLCSDEYTWHITFLYIILLSDKFAKGVEDTEEDLDSNTVKGDLYTKHQILTNLSFISLHNVIRQSDAMLDFLV